jgi:hypothetical protein
MNDRERRRYKTNLEEFKVFISKEQFELVRKALKVKEFRTRLRFGLR